MHIEREVPEGTQLLLGDPEKLIKIWNTISNINGVFDDYNRGRFDNFMRLFMSPDTWWLEREDGNGILYLTMIKPGLSAHAHIIFWDRKLRTREQFVRNCILFAMNLFDLKKMNLTLPDFAGAAIGFAERVGFKKEGEIRNWSYSNNRLYSVAWYGILKEEAINGHGLLSADEDREHSKTVRGATEPNGPVEPVLENGSGGASDPSAGDAVQPKWGTDGSELSEPEPPADAGLSVAAIEDRRD